MFHELETIYPCFNFPMIGVQLLTQCCPENTIKTGFCASSVRMLGLLLKHA